MAWLFDACYLLLLLLGSPWLLYMMVTQGKYRDGWAERLWGEVPPREGDRSCAWFHAVSLGEVNLLVTLVPAFQAAHPDWDCVISTTTLTGLAQAKAKFPNLTVCYAPFDFSWAVENAFARLRPSLLVLAELELWPNWIAAAKRHSARIAVVNGRLSERSERNYSLVGWLSRGMFAALDLVAVQTPENADGFRQLGAAADRVRVTGSIKFDGACGERRDLAVRRLAELAGLTADDVVFVAGSTQEGEEAIALEAFRAAAEAHPRLRLMLVPRHPQRFDDVAALLEQTGLPWKRRSRLGSEQENRADNGPWRVLLVDTVGELAAWWGTAHIAYVGGSMGTRGGQNMIEPAAFGAATCFGPRTENFRDVVLLLTAAGAAKVVNDGGELTAFVRRCLDEPAFAVDLGERAKSLVRQQKGATDMTVRLLSELIAGQAAPPTVTRAAA